MFQDRRSSHATPSKLTFRGHEFELEAQACDFCGSEDFEPFWRQMRHGIDLPTVFCSKCGLCQTRPRPTPAALTLFYQTLYNQFHGRTSELRSDDEYVTRSRRHAEKRVAQITALVDPKAPIKALEIGAGVGQFQLLARRATAWQLEGIEPGRPQAAFCGSIGVQVRNEFFDDAVLADGAYDLVVSFHVLEHVRSPSAFLRKINRILAPGGTLYLEVPNLARPGSRLKDFFQLPHLYNFSAVTLRNYVTGIAGCRPLYSAERNQNLVLISRRSDPARQERDGEYERYDVANFIQRMRMLERVFMLARAIPDVSVLGKVKSTLMAI